MWQAWSTLGRLYSSRNNLKSADPAFKNALLHGVTHADVYYDYGVHLLNQMRHAEAVRMFDQALARDSSLPQVKNNRRKALALGEDYAKAVEGLDGAESAAILHDAGVIAMAHGNLVLAGALFERALDASPEPYPQAEQNLEKLTNMNSDEE